MSAKKASALEIANVLFLDVVQYSLMAMEQQRSVMEYIQGSIKRMPHYRKAKSKDEVLTLPTGDGVALVFFGSPEVPVYAAVEIAEALKKNAHAQVRMGVHSGPVYRIADINANRNVTGGGINMAQRVMDVGDAGHILVSAKVAEDLLQLEQWRGFLHEVGEADDKHGNAVRVFNLYSSNYGNPKSPTRIRNVKSRVREHQRSKTTDGRTLPRTGPDSSRYLSFARLGVLDMTTADKIVQHMLSPDPEIESILQLPTLLASSLQLRSSVAFRVNGTQMIRDCLEVIIFHEWSHSCRPGEEAARAATKLRSEEGPTNRRIGTLLCSDVDHPSVRKMARTIWPGEIVEVRLADLIFGENASAGAEICSRYSERADRNTFAAIIPHVVWSNGAVLDVKTIAREVRKSAPLSTVVVDGIQATGHIPIDIESYNKENEDIDFYVGCGHKWLCGPETTGFARVGSLYSNDCAQCQQFLAASDLISDGSGLAFRYQGDQIGTNQRGVAKGLMQAVELFQRGNVNNLRYRQIRKNADGIRCLLKSIPQMILLDPPDVMRSGIVSFTLGNKEDVEVDRLAAALIRAGLQPSVYQIDDHPNAVLNGRRFIRLSPGPKFCNSALNELASIMRGCHHEQ